MKKIEKPIVKVVNFKAMDVIATSGESQSKVRFGIHSLTTENSDDSYGF